MQFLSLVVYFSFIAFAYTGRFRMEDKKAYQCSGKSNITNFAMQTTIFFRLQLETIWWQRVCKISKQTGNLIKPKKATQIN